MQKHTFGRPYKGKEVLLWKADKVMVRLSIVKIEVWPFKTLFIYSYILSLWFQWVVFTVQAGYCGASLTGRVVEQRLARSELSHDSEGASDILRYWVTGSEEQEWHFQAGLSGDSVRKLNGSSYLHTLPHWGSLHTPHEMLQVNILKWLNPKQPVNYVCPIKISYNTDFQLRRRKQLYQIKC